MKEIWKDIEGYEGIYQVSSEGRVRSLNRVEDRGRHIKGKILKPCINHYGYCIVGLFKNGTQKKNMVHRLVAEAFIPNPDNKPYCDHINTCKIDNRVENIRWVTHKENMNNPLSIKQRKEHTEWCKRGKEHHGIKPVIQYDKKNNFIREYFSIREASKENSVSEQSICSCCRGNLKAAGGYIWKYKKGQP